MSVSAISVKLNFSLKFDGYFPKPSHHPKNTDVVIISTDCEEDCCGIYEYNLTKNTFNKIYSYILYGSQRQEFYPFYHGQFIDSKNELLYMFGCGEFGIFDLNTNVINPKNTLCICSDCPQSKYIPSPINELHILSNDTIHYI
eukprot:538333_1